MYLHSLASHDIGKCYCKLRACGIATNFDREETFLEIRLVLPDPEFRDLESINASTIGAGNHHAWAKTIAGIIFSRLESLPLFLPWKLASLLGLGASTVLQELCFVLGK